MWPTTSNDASSNSVTERSTLAPCREVLRASMRRQSVCAHHKYICESALWVSASALSASSGEITRDTTQVSTAGMWFGPCLSAFCIAANVLASTLWWVKPFGSEKQYLNSYKESSQASIERGGSAMVQRKRLLVPWACVTAASMPGHTRTSYRMARKAWGSPSELRSAFDIRL